MDDEQLIKFNSNLTSGGTGADNFEYTNPQGRWSGNKPLVNSQGIKLTLIINLKEQTN